MGTTATRGTAGAWRLGVSPLFWTNDVLEELGGTIPVERCLGEAAGAHARVRAASGARVLVYGECGRMAPGGAPLDEPSSARAALGADEFDGYAGRLGEFARWLAGEHGREPTHHHNLMMVAQSLDEGSTLFDRAAPVAGLLLDTGHAAAAGFDCARLIERFGERIVHVHLKDVCGTVLRAPRDRDGSCKDGVRDGMFAVPGDGEVDLAPAARFVRDSGDDGRLVVEAEGDRARTPPLAAVERGRARVLAAMERENGR